MDQARNYDDRRHRFEASKMWVNLRLSPLVIGSRVFFARQGERAPRVPLFAVLLFALTGCGQHSPAIVDVSIAADGITPQRIEYSDWSLALSRAVRGNEVDLTTLRIDPTPLNAFLQQAAGMGQHKTPGLLADENEQLAFLVNLHNAAMLAALVRHPDTTHAPAAAICSIDGVPKSTDELRTMIRVLSNDDWRVPFALYDGRRDGPPLWPRPILPESLDAQWSQIAESALRQPQIVLIDHGRQHLWLWQGLYDNRGRLIAQYEKRYHTTDATVLSALLDLSDADRRAELNTAVGYRVVQLGRNAAPAVVQTRTVLH